MDELEAHRVANRKHYAANKDAHLARNRASVEACRALIREAKNVPCADCGQRYPHYVMDFDHLDPEKKLANVGQMAKNGLQRTREEIAKCEVVCANCHRERTHGSPVLKAVVGG